MTAPSPWRPICEYPTTAPDTGPVVLARDDEKRPVLVRLMDGKWYICPAAPVWYGDRQFGFQTVSNLVEYMDIPA